MNILGLQIGLTGLILVIVFGTIVANVRYRGPISATLLLTALAGGAIATVVGALMAIWG